MMLEGYALVLAGGKTFIGKATEDALEPAYEAHVAYQMDEGGNSGILRECTPLFGSGTLRRLPIPPGAVVIACSRLSGKERELWSGAIRQCEQMIAAVRAAETGLLLPPPPVLVK